MGLALITSSVGGLGNISLAPAITPEIVKVAETLPAEDKKAAIQKVMTVEEYVRNYFSDIPIMVEVARCESRFRQHDKNGQTLRGEQNKLDFGVMQINEYYHGEDSKKLGLDIETLEGNTAYARFLYEKYGVQPWSSSSKCWSKTVAYSQYKELAAK